MSERLQIQIFKTVAIAEAVSWAGLLIGMFFKYLTDAREVGVEIFGPIHGTVFVAYVVATLVVSRTLRWPIWTTLVALACSIPPFATAVFEVRATRNGLLRPAADDPQKAKGRSTSAPTPR